MFGGSERYCTTQGHSDRWEVDFCRVTNHNHRAEDKETPRQGKGIVATLKGVVMDVGTRE